MSRIALASAAAALAFSATPAVAQSAPYFSYSKTQAILGGESRLASIMAEQSGQPVPPVAVSPAGYSAPLTRAAMPIYRPAIAMDQPDVFNSVALPIAHTSLDRRWRKVANGPVGPSSASYASELASLSAMEKLDVPALVVHGRQDPIPLASSESVAQALRARLVVLENCGHVPYVEQPQSLFDAVRQFLTELSPARGHTR